MNAKEIKIKIKKFLLNDFVGSGQSDLDNGESLLEKGIIDSVKMLELIEFIESNYKIKVDEDDLIPENFDTIDAIVAYIQNHKKS